MTIILILITIIGAFMNKSWHLRPSFNAFLQTMYLGCEGEFDHANRVLRLKGRRASLYNVMFIER